MNKYNTHNSVQLLFTCKVTQATVACLLWLFKTDCLWPSVLRDHKATCSLYTLHWCPGTFNIVCSVISIIIFVTASHLGCHAIVDPGIARHLSVYNSVSPLIWFVMLLLFQVSLVVELLAHVYQVISLCHAPFFSHQLLHTTYWHHHSAELLYLLVWSPFHSPQLLCLYCSGHCQSRHLRCYASWLWYCQSQVVTLCCHALVSSLHCSFSLPITSSFPWLSYF